MRFLLIKVSESDFNLLHELALPSEEASDLASKVLHESLMEEQANEPEQILEQAS